MVGWLKNLVKDSLIYGFGVAISRFLQVIILPLITGALTIPEFGYYSNYVIFYTIAGGFFILGLENAVARFYYDSDNEKYHRTVFSTAFFSVLLCSLAFAVIFYFFPGDILMVIGVPEKYGEALFYVLFTVPVLVLNNFFLSWFKWKQQKLYFLINSIGTVACLLLPLLLLKPLGFLLLFKIIFFSQLVVALISTVLSHKYIGLEFSSRLLVPMIKYGFPWMLVFVLGVSRSYLDRFFLMRYLDENAYGIYNFSVRLSTFLALIMTAFDMSFGPLSFSIWNKPDAPRFFARLQSVYVFGISVAACAIAIISPLLIVLLGGEKYNGAESVLPVLLFSAIPLSLINFSGLGTVYAKKSFLNTITLLIGFSIVLLLNFFLTPLFFQYGAVVASLIGHLAISVSGYYFSNKYYKIGFHFGRDALVFLLFLIFSIVAVWWEPADTEAYSILIKLGTLLFAACVIAMAAFQEELGKIAQFLNTIKARRRLATPNEVNG